MTTIIWFFLCVVLIQCILHVTNSTTLSGGTYSSTIKTLRLSESPYYLEDDLIIAATASLIIENKVEVYMNSNKIEVKGVIITACSSMDTTTSSALPSRGVHSTDFVYISGGHSIKLLSDGYGEFCNTKFESMAVGIIDDSDNSNSYVDHCHFHDIPYALQFNSYQRHHVTHSIFTNIHKSVCEEGNIVFDDCQFDTFEKLFDSTPSNIVMTNNEISNAKYTCIELYACADCLLANNVISDCPTAIKVKSNGNAILQITNNTISNSQRYAIETYHRNTAIVGNSFVNNVNAIFADENVLYVVNNTFESNTNTAIIAQFDVDNDGRIEGNTFVYNGDSGSCTNMIEVVEGGHKLTIKRNNFRNNSCQNSLLTVYDNTYIILEENQFVENSVSTTNNLISVIVSSAMTSRTNTTVLRNTFHRNQPVNNVIYVEGNHVVNVVDNTFTSLPSTSTLYINNGKTSNLVVSSNNFTSLTNVQNYHIYLQSTSYDVIASNNYYGEIASIRDISSKLYDQCNDASLGQILFCPWMANQINIDFQCDCNALDLCTSTTCSSNTEPITTNTISPSNTASNNNNNNNDNIPSTITAKTPTMFPTARPIISPSFKGALFVITFGENTHHNNTALIMQRIVRNIINNTVSTDCLLELSFTAQTVTSYEGLLSVCDESSERKILFLFDSDGGLDELELALYYKFHLLPEIAIYIEDTTLSNNPSMKTTTQIIFVHESAGKINLREHLMYFLIVSAVLVISCFIGIIQYCRYEGRQSREYHKQKALVRDRQRPKMQQMMPVCNNSRSAPSEPGSSLQRLNTNPSLQFSDIHHPSQAQYSRHDGYYYDEPQPVQLELAERGERVTTRHGVHSNSMMAAPTMPNSKYRYQNYRTQSLNAAYPTQQHQTVLFHRNVFDDFDDDEDDHSGDSEQLYVKVAGQGTLNAPVSMGNGTMMRNTVFMECESSSDDQQLCLQDQRTDQSSDRRQDTLRTDTTNEDRQSDELQCVRQVADEVDLMMTNAASLDTNGQSPVIEGDDRAITGNLDLARPQTIR